MTRGLVVLAWLIASVTAARAEEAASSRRRVVVLEYRAGAAALPDLPARLTTALGRLTSLTVVDLNGARQAFGPTLDRAVGECAGDAACLADVGAKVGVDEVILVGISELGDVIVTLQRIGVAARAVDARIAESLAPEESPDDDALAQYLARLLPAADFVRFGTIRVTATERDAEVHIGGEARGRTPVPPLRVRAPASYDLRVTKRGFVPFRATVQVPPDGELEVLAELSREGAAPRWYQRWWVLAAAGALVAGATGTTIWLATRGDDRVHVTGTIP